MSPTTDAAGGGRDVNPVLKFIVQIGTTAALALYFGYLIGGRLDKRTEEISAKLDLHVERQMEAQKLLEQQGETLRTIVTVLIQSCLNSTRNIADRNACWPDVPPGYRRGGD